MRVFVVPLTSSMKHFESNNDIFAIQNGSFGIIWHPKVRSGSSKMRPWGHKNHSCEPHMMPKASLGHQSWVFGSPYGCQGVTFGGFQGHFGVIWATKSDKKVIQNRYSKKLRFSYLILLTFDDYVTTCSVENLDNIVVFTAYSSSRTFIRSQTSG